MMAIIWRIISAVMAMVFFVTGSGSLASAAPVADIDVFDMCMDGFLGGRDEATRVFYSYSEWKLFCETLENPKMADYASKINESLFDKHNLVLADIECSAGNVEVKIATAMEYGTNLSIDYLCVDELDMVGTTAICYNTIFAVTSKKYITNVKLNKLDDMTVPFLIDESIPNLYQVVQTDFKPECYDENFDKSSYLFSDYESFREFTDKGKWKLDKYIDIVDEKYFENKNLVVAVVSLADGGDGLRISYPIENGNTLQFKCYAVSQPCIAIAAECEEAVFIETSKKIENVELERVDKISIPFMLNGSNPMIYN